MFGTTAKLRIANTVLTLLACNETGFLLCLGLLALARFTTGIVLCIHV